MINDFPGGEKQDSGQPHEPPLLVPTGYLPLFPSDRANDKNNLDFVTAALLQCHDGFSFSLQWSYLQNPSNYGMSPPVRTEPAGG